MLAVDADSGNCLGLLSGQVWTRKGRRTVSHDLRDLSDKESQRWIATALATKPLLAKAAMVTALGDRESDIFALYASAAEQHFHVIARSMHERKLGDESGLHAAGDAMTVVQDRRPLMLRAIADSAPNVSQFSNCALARSSCAGRKPNRCAICRHACRSAMSMSARSIRMSAPSRYTGGFSPRTQ